MNRKPIIGIVGKPQCDDMIWNKICISNEIKDAVNANGAVAVGIIPQSKIKEIKEGKPFSYQYYYLDDNSLNDLYVTIDLCDGIILEGGIVICDYEQKIVNYCIEVKKPILGICCGCINMALATGGSISLENYEYLKEKHFSLTNMNMHNINLENDSKLFSVMRKNNFEVNSIHKCKIENTGKYSVKGYADDGVVEVLEFNDDNFNIGVQWHPEFIVHKQEENLIFKEFISYIKNRKKDYNL